MLNNLTHIPVLLVKVISLQERYFWLLKLYNSRYVQFVCFLTQQANSALSLHFISMCICKIVKDY